MLVRGALNNSPGNGICENIAEPNTALIQCRYPANVKVTTVRRPEFVTGTNTIGPSDAD